MLIDTEKLKSTRKSAKLTLKQVASALNSSVPKVHRLESGIGRTDLDFLEKYCQVLGLDLYSLLKQEAEVPIIGIVDEHSEVLPLTPNTPHTTPAPLAVPQPQRLAAVRWEAKGPINLISGHLLFFYSDVEGVHPKAWGNRAIIRREDGTQRIGWPFLEAGQIHIRDAGIAAEFNVQISWASPIIAVISPTFFALRKN